MINFKNVMDEVLFVSAIMNNLSESWYAIRSIDRMHIMTVIADNYLYNKDCPKLLAPVFLKHVNIILPLVNGDLNKIPCMDEILNGENLQIIQKLKWNEQKELMKNLVRENTSGRYNCILKEIIISNPYNFLFDKELALGKEFADEIYTKKFFIECIEYACNICPERTFHDFYDSEETKENLDAMEYMIKWELFTPEEERHYKNLIEERKVLPEKLANEVQCKIGDNSDPLL